LDASKALPKSRQPLPSWRARPMLHCTKTRQGARACHTGCPGKARR